MKWDYSFCLWPDETWGFSRELFDVWRLVNSRVVMTWTEQEFEWYRSRMSHHGFTMREVERTPHYVPEPVK